MGISASQARFLQLTARRSDIEYEVQQINQQRLSLADTLSDASSTYNDKMNNRVLVFSYNNGTGSNKVTITYDSYKNFMNQQSSEAQSSTQNKYYLVSASGNKVVVQNEEDMETMMENDPSLSANDFMIVDYLNDTNRFQEGIRNGDFYFALAEKETLTDETTGEEYSIIKSFKTQAWDSLGGGAISDNLDTSDDAAAEAEYEKIKTKVNQKDKMLELELDKLETERKAITTEMDDVKKVIEENTERSFKIFS